MSPPLSQPFIYLYNYITNLVLSTYLLVVEDGYLILSFLVGSGLEFFFLFLFENFDQKIK
jgi:hypothetical protein